MLRMAARRPSGWTAILLLSAIALSMVACRGQSTSTSDLKIDVQISPSQSVVGPVSVEVRIFDASGAPVKGATVEVEGNMSHAGMVPVKAGAEDVGDGRYLTRDFRFTMAGDWSLTVSAGLPDGRKAVKEFPVAVSRGGAEPPTTPAASR